jgi:hypothetical protein
MGEIEQDEVATFVGARLDAAYVREVAKAVASALADGAPVEVAFQPGDGTRYDLVFVPVQALRTAPPRRTTSGVEWDDRAALGVSRHVGAAVVSWVGHGAHGLDLAVGGFVGEYLAALYGTTVGSGYALAHLLERVAEEMR